MGELYIEPGLVTVATLTPIIIGLTQVIKRGLRLDDAQAPMVALGLGLLLGLLAQLSRDLPMTGSAWWNGAFMGLAAGLAASGAYSQTKALTEPVEVREAKKAAARGPRQPRVRTAPVQEPRHLDDERLHNDPPSVVPADVSDHYVPPRGRGKG